MNAYNFMDGINGGYTLTLLFGIALVACHWTYLVLELVVLEVVYLAFMKKYYHLLLEAGGEVQGLSISLGQWHTVNVLEPTVILECKDGKYEPLGKEDMIER